jgi:NADH dehydrogenase [ubiquinone] 1 alpha subcomplex assembly factor 1
MQSDLHLGRIPTRLLTLLVAAGMLTAASARATSAQPVSADSRTLMTFSGAAHEPRWTAVNDSVMGGLSQGSPSIADGQLHFSGTLSLANNGGFSSVRATGRTYDLSGDKALLLRVKGDGRTYQLRLATSARYRGSAVSYRADFPTTAGQWTDVRVSLASFVPTWRGRQLKDLPLDPARVEEIGLLIGDGREGPFRLVVDSIGVE